MDVVEFLKWASTLNPGDISNYAVLVILIVGGMFLLHKEHVVTGPRWRDKVEECKKCNTEKSELSAALVTANEAIKKAAESDTQKLVELERLRVQREYGWRIPAQQPGQTP